MKKILFGIGAVIIVILLLLQTRFSVFLQMDYDGYAIEDKSLRALLLTDPENAPDEDSVPLYSFGALDYIYNRGNSYYMGETKKTQIDMGFPMLINGGAGVWFSDDTGTLFNVDFDEFSTYRGLSVSERISYNPDGEKAADDEYLFAGLNNGFFVNLDTFTYDDRGLTREVAMNSMIYFTEDFFAYCEKDDDRLVYNICRNTPDNAKIRINDEELTYRELLLNLHVIYDKISKKDTDDSGLETTPEVPTPEVIELPVLEQTDDETAIEEEPEKQKPERQKRERAQKSSSGSSGANRPSRPQSAGTQGIRPDSMRPDKTPRKGAERQKDETYVKPTVEITGIDPRVYRILITLNVQDPANRIDQLRKIQFEFYEQLSNGKEELAMRTYSGSSGTVTAGAGKIRPDTRYRVIAYFTYSDEYGDKVTESLLSDDTYVTTNSFSTIGPIYFKTGNENGVDYTSVPIYYDNYLEIVNATFTADSDEEAIYGIDSKGLILSITKDGVPNRTYDTIVDPAVVGLIKKSNPVNIDSLPNLDPKSDWHYVINAKDYFGNSLELHNNTGAFKTCKSRPLGDIELIENEIGNTKLRINVNDPHQSSVPAAGGTNDDRDLYLVLSTKKIENYTDDIITDVNAFIQNNNSRVNFGQEDESTVHYAYKFNSGEYSLDSQGGLSVQNIDKIINVLDLNTRYYAYLLADYDLDNYPPGQDGVVRHGKIAELSFKSASLSSLGNIFVDVEVSNITAHSATIMYTLNKAKTNDRLEEYLSDIMFTIETEQGTTPGIHSAMVFDNDAMKCFTGYDENDNPYTLLPSESETMMMDARYFDGGTRLSTEDKDRVTAFTDLKGRHIVENVPAFYLESMTEYKIAPVMYAKYLGKKYEMNVVLTRSSFKTMREPAKVTVTNKLLAAGTLRFKVKIDDPDDAITGNSGHVVVLNIYDSMRNLVRAVRVPKNTDQPVAMEFKGLPPNETFIMNFIAQEYNLGYSNETFKSNELIHQEFVDNPVALSGTIKLQSLETTTGGRLKANVRVRINDADRSLNGTLPYYIKVEKNGTDITADYDSAITTVSNYSYSSGNQIQNDSAWNVDRGNHKYKMTLYVILEGNELVLDTLEFNSKDVITKITNAANFIDEIKKNPSGRFVLTEDIDMDEVDLDANGNVKSTVPSAGIVGTFYGEIDFQGYTLKKNNYKNEGAMFGNIAPKAEIYNAVLELSDQTTTREYDKGIFCRHNYGHIHDIYVHYTGGSGTQNVYYGLVAARNASSGIIERFVINNDPQEGRATFSARSNCGLLVYDNEGIVRNGYVYGMDINSVVAKTSVGGAINVGGVAGVQTARGQMSGVFSLVNVVVSSPRLSSNQTTRDTQYGAIIGSASGSSRRMYSVGKSMYNEAYNNTLFDRDVVGPVLGTSAATQSDIYYWNQEGDTYNNAKKQSRIGLESLYDYNWQATLLGSAFNTQPVEVGYYPQLKMNEELPEQQLLPLPSRNVSRIVEVVSSEVVSYGTDGNSALVMLRLNNQRNATIQQVDIENLTTELYEDDTYQTTMVDGYTTMYLTVSNPQKFVSQYKITNIKASIGKSTQNVTSEALLNVDFYRMIHNANDWYEFVVKKPNENARLAEDIDFKDVPYGRIRVTSNYTGKLDGGHGLGGAQKEANSKEIGFALKNISFRGSGYDPYVFTRVDGEINNICIDNFYVDVSNRTYNGFVVSLYGVVQNVHVNNAHIFGKEYLSPLVCYAYAGSAIQDCSVSNSEIQYKEAANTNTEGKMGMIAAYATNSRITNCFAREITITANDLRSCAGAGAIVGYSDVSVLQNLYATGDVTVRGSYVGGIVGYHKASNISNMMSNIISRVNVTSYQDKVGGIVGGMYITESPINERTNMSGVALGNVLCANTDAENVSYTTGDMVGFRATLYGSESQLYNGMTGAQFDEDGLMITDESYSGIRKAWDKNTYGMITYDQVIDPATYTSSSLLNMDYGVYDYSKVESKHLPTLYYYESSVKMPFQDDDLPICLADITRNLIKVTNVYVNASPGMGGTITLDIKGPAGYKVTGYTIEKLNSSLRVSGVTQGSGDEATTKVWINVPSETSQEHFLDSYMLTELRYAKEDGTGGGRSDFRTEPVRIPLTLFAEINDLNTWNNYMAETNDFGGYENYRVISNINFGTGGAVKMNAKIGRLVGDLSTGTGSGTMVTMSNIRINEANKNFIFRLNSELSNIKFVDCNIDAKSRDCIGLVGTSAARVYDVQFENIRIDTANASNAVKNFIGIIGYQNGGCLGTYDPANPEKGRVKLHNVKIGYNAADGTSTIPSPYAGGLVGYSKGNTLYTNIIADSVKVMGNGRVGGLVGATGKASFKHISCKDFTVQSYNNDYLGGIVGLYQPGRITGNTGAYFTDVILTGTPLSHDSEGYVDTSTTVISFKNGNNSSNQIGGLIGRAEGYWIGRDNRGTRTSRTNDWAGNYGNAGGMLPTYYDVNTSNVVDGIVVSGYGEIIGGLFGYNYDDYDSHCYNTLITAIRDRTDAVKNSVGGISGSMPYSKVYSVTRNTLIRINNHGYVGLAVGNQHSSASISYSKVEDSKIKLENTTGAVMKNVGGVVGRNYYPLYYSTAYNVTIDAPGHENVGGISGYVENTLSRCFYYARPVSDSSPVAESVYYVKGKTYVGGVAGYHYAASLQYAYSNANVEAVGNYAGGISGAYRNNFIATMVSGKENYAYSTASMHYNYFAGTVKAYDYAGGLIGDLTMRTDISVRPKGNGGGYGAPNDQENGGRRSAAISAEGLGKTGSSNEVNYTYKNLGLASVVEATNGSNAYAMAGNVDGFEGKANRHNRTTGTYAHDVSSKDRADYTFFWDKTQIKTNTSQASANVVVLDEMVADNNTSPRAKNDYAASMGNTITVSGNQMARRYVSYSNNNNSIYGAAKEKDACESLNVRLITGTDLQTHAPYYSAYWVATNTGTSQSSWKGRNYYVILAKDTGNLPNPYANGNYGSSSGKSYLPHVRVNNNDTASDYLTRYQVSKNINLPVPTSVLSARRAMRGGISMPVLTDPEVYASDVDKINVEFGVEAPSTDAVYLRLYYGDNVEPEEQLLVEERVYTFKYDFAKKIRVDYGYADMNAFRQRMAFDGKSEGEDYVAEDVFAYPEYLTSYTVKDEDENENGEGADTEGGSSVGSGTSATDSNASGDQSTDSESEGEIEITGRESVYKDEFTYKPRQLARHVMTYGTAYYYITNDGVVRGYGSSAADDSGESNSVEDSSAELIAGNFIHIYNGKGLTKDGIVRDLASGGDDILANKGLKLLKDKTVALQSFDLNGKGVRTYWTHTLISSDGVIERQAQILKSKNGSMNIMDASVESVKDSVVMYNKDGADFLTVLGVDGIMTDLYQGDNINSPEDFKPSGIVYMTNNLETTAPFILVEYQNGGIVGYNYMTCEYLFNNFKKNQMSLLDYLKVYFDGDKSKFKTNTGAYSATSKLAEIAGTPERLAKMLSGLNDGGLVENNNREGAETAQDKTTYKGMVGDETARASADTKLRNLEDETGFTTGRTDSDEITGTTEEPTVITGQKATDGMLAGGGGESEAKGRGAGDISSNRTEGEGSSNSDEETLVMAANSYTSAVETDALKGNSKADGMGGGTGENVDHGNGEGDVLKNEAEPNELPDPTFDEKDDIEKDKKDKDSDDSSKKGTGTGISKGAGKAAGAGSGSGSSAVGTSAKGSKAAAGNVAASGDATGAGEGSDDMLSTTKASQSIESSKDSEAEKKENEDDSTGVAVGKASPKVKDITAEATAPAEDKNSDDEKVTTEKKLVTVYNQSTGTFEIIDLDKFLSAPGYQSENARLAIKDFSAVGGYATAEKPDDDDENRRGIALYILASLAVLAGVGGGIYYRKKHKMKV